MIADELKYRIRSAFGYEPTAEQQGAMDVFATFMVDSRMMPVMVMRGSAGTGYYVTPGGSPSTIEGSGARIPDGEYPILAPNGGNWKQPQIGGAVINRGIRIHYGYPYPRNWTQGCFVISSDYSIEKGRIKYQRDESLKAMGDFDSCLGGGPLYKYSFNYRDSNGELKTKSRYGSRFSTPINYELILKSR